MKKILFLVSALFMSLVVFAAGGPIVDLMDRLPFNSFDPGVEQGATLESIHFEAQYKGGGFDLQGEDLVFQGKEDVQVNTVVVYFTGDRTNSGQITLDVYYFDADGESYYNQAECQSPPVYVKNGKAQLSLLERKDLTIDRILISTGWENPADSEIIPSPENPLELTITGWIVKHVPPVPQKIGHVITFEEFPSDFEFTVGATSSYYPMPEWGWASGAAEFTVVEKEIGNNVLKVQPTDYGFAAFFEKLKLPDEYTVEDIHTIQFDVFWEEYAAEGVALEVGDDVTSTEAILYIGTGAKLGEGVNFGTENNIAFKGNPTPVIGTIGEWFTYSVALADFLNSSLNNPEGGGSFDIKGINVVFPLNEFRFGIGINANNGTFYLDNIMFLNEKGNPLNVEQVKASAASAKVVAIENGLAILGGESAIIYGIDGRVVATTSASTIVLPKGVYIVKVGGEVVKAIVK